MVVGSRWRGWASEWGGDCDKIRSIVNEVPGHVRADRVRGSVLKR